MPILLILVIVLIVIIAIILAILKTKGGLSEGKVKQDYYFLKKSLFTPAERSFYGVLESIDYEGISIVSKVRLADIFGIKKGLEKGDRQRALNRITSKHIDFLFIDKSDGKPILGIELDDSSHELEDKAARDSFVDSVFESASLPILHVPCKQAYDPKEIRRLLDDTLNKTTKTIGG